MVMLRILLAFLLIFSTTTVYAQIAAAPVAQPNPADDKVAQAELLSQQIRAEERNMDLQASGLKWVPWQQAGKNVQDYIAKRDNFSKSLIGSGRHVDVAVADLDGNNQPDIVLYFWDHCGSQGCLFKIYFDKITKRSENYFGWQFIPYKKGVMLDHAYFSL